MAPKSHSKKRREARPAEEEATASTEDDEVAQATALLEEAMLSFRSPARARASAAVVAAPAIADESIYTSIAKNTTPSSAVSVIAPAAAVPAPVPSVPASTASAPASTPASTAASDRFLKVEAILASLESGAVRLARGSYLIKLAKAGKVVSRRQELPDTAFYDYAELLALLHKLREKFKDWGPEEGDMRFLKLIHALSYRWYVRVPRCARCVPQLRRHRVRAGSRPATLIARASTCASLPRPPK